MTKRGQTFSQPILFILFLFMFAVIMLSGYYVIKSFIAKSCQTSMLDLTSELSRSIDLMTIKRGAVEEKKFRNLCDKDKIYFIDKDKDISAERFNKTPIIKDAILSNSDYNMFLLTWKGDTESYSVGNIELQSPYYACFRPVADTIEMFLEGAGKGTIIKHKNNRYNCGPIAVVIPESLDAITPEDRVDITSQIPGEVETQLDNARENLDVERTSTCEDGITTVDIEIRPKQTGRGNRFQNVRYFENIPKDCIDDLNAVIEDLGEEITIIRGDPLIMWHFNNLGEEQSASFSVNDDCALDDCRDLIQSMAFVQRRESGVNIDFSASSTPPSYNQRVEFSADITGASDLCEDTEFRWDFNGDGTVDIRTSDASEEYTYAEPREYQASVTINCIDGAHSADTTVNVINREPSAQIDSPQAGATFTTGDQIQFSGTANDPEDGALFGNRLVWSSNQQTINNRGTSFTRTLSAGQHTITLTVTDSRGASSSASVRITVTAQNTPPQVTIIRPYRRDEDFNQGSDIIFEGTATDDKPLDDNDFVWKNESSDILGRGSDFTLTNNNFSPGYHTITLEVTDSDNAVGTASIRIKINAVSGGGGGSCVGC